MRKKKTSFIKIKFRMCNLHPVLSVRCVLASKIQAMALSNQERKENWFEYNNNSVEMCKCFADSHRLLVSESVIVI